MFTAPNSTSGQIVDIVSSKVVLLSITIIIFSSSSSSSSSSSCTSPSLGTKSPSNKRLESKQFETTKMALYRQVLPALQVGHWDTINEPHSVAESLALLSQGIGKLQPAGHTRPFTG